MIIFDLNTNDAESLLNLCKTYEPPPGDARENRRLENALNELRQALITHLSTEPSD